MVTSLTNHGYLLKQKSLECLGSAVGWRRRTESEPLAFLEGEWRGDNGLGGDVAGPALNKVQSTSLSLAANPVAFLTISVPLVKFFWVCRLAKWNYQNVLVRKMMMMTMGNREIRGGFFLKVGPTFLAEKKVVLMWGLVWLCWNCYWSRTTRWCADENWDLEFFLIKNSGDGDGDGVCCYVPITKDRSELYKRLWSHFPIC